MKKLITLALALIVLNACNKEIPNEQEDLTIKLSGSAYTLSTKAEGADFPNSSIAVFAAASTDDKTPATDFSELSIDHEKAIPGTEGESGSFDFGWDENIVTPPTWPGSTYWTFRAYSPSGILSEEDDEEGLLSIALSNSDTPTPDVLFAYKSPGESGTIINKASGTVSFGFTHLLSQLVVNMKNPSSEDVIISKIEVVVAANGASGTFDAFAEDPDDETWTLATASAVTFTNDNSESGWTIDAGTKTAAPLIGPILLIPGSQESVTVNIYLAGDTDDASISFTLGSVKKTETTYLTLTKGTKTVVTVSTAADEVAVSGTVAAWAEESYTQIYTPTEP